MDEKLAKALAAGNAKATILRILVTGLIGD